MGDQPQERKIGELCTLDIIDLPILNLEEIGRPFEIIDLGLSPSPMSISSNLSADMNPRPNFPSVPSIGFSIKNYYKSQLLESAVDHC
jgi:hypothetical protein